ncbi:EamA family transporter [uncultured Alsobacter sp.]|uniref:DMT family transporter n=1 Tax=uncultured Alsobacter sp. TaxID=1748258 RepID=UPI0025D9AE82|nr:EamA family transporter [uncultured Alsobacter sp.]
MSSGRSQAGQTRPGQLSPGSARPGLVEFALLGGISLAWGSSYMFTKIAVTALPPVSLVAGRTVLAAAVMAAVALAKGGVRLPWRELPVFAVVGIASGALPLILIATSVSYVNSSVTATAMALVPLWAGVLAAALGQRPTPRSLVGLALGFAGILVLFGPQALAALGDSARGALAALAASLVFSSSLFLSRRVRHRDILTVATVTQVMSALFAVAVALVVDGLPTVIPSASVLGAVAVLGIANTALANLLLFILLARAGAGFTSLNNYLVPTVAVACGALFLGERLTAASVSGAGLILLGVAVATLPALPWLGARKDGAS